VCSSKHGAWHEHGSMEAWKHGSMDMDESRAAEPSLFKFLISASFWSNFSRFIYLKSPAGAYV